MNIHSHVVIPVDEYEKMLLRVKLVENPKQELASRVTQFLRYVSEEIRNKQLTGAENLATFLEDQSITAPKWMWENALYEAGIDPKKLP